MLNWFPALTPRKGRLHVGNPLGTGIACARLVEDPTIR
jgi:hypothetical protein